MYRIREAERIRKVANLTPRASSSPRMAWVVTFWSMISIWGSAPDTCFRWSQNAMASRFSVALERSAYGTPQIQGSAPGCLPRAVRNPAGWVAGVERVFTGG
jgi:hypothetical protein